MKDKIIYNTKMFICIILFINIFNLLFGKANSLVGVTIVVAALVLMEKDLTKEASKNFSKLLFINLILGFFTFFAGNNIFIGIILNFLALGAIGYFLSYNLNKSIVVPFGLQYLFMLYTPVYGVDFIKRIVGLVFGAIAIMAIQFVIHFKDNKNNKPNEEEKLSEGEDKDIEYKVIKIFKKEFSVNTIRFNYAIRIGLLAALTGFLIDFFKLEQGRWMAYTVFSLTELYAENCKSRARERLEGTVIGALIVIISFIFIKDSSLRLIIVLLAGYLNPFAHNYKEAMICVTVSVIASVSLNSGVIEVTMKRLMYVGIGIIFSLLANKFILYTTKESYETLNLNENVL